jgi:hypothetical protein
VFRCELVNELLGPLVNLYGQIHPFEYRQKSFQRFGSLRKEMLPAGQIMLESVLPTASFCCHQERGADNEYTSN